MSGAAPPEADRPSAVMTAIRGTSSRREHLLRALRPVNAGWLCVLAGLGLSLLGVQAIDVAEALEPAAPGELSAVAAKQAVFLIVGMLAATVIALPHFRFVAIVSWAGMLLTVGLLVFLLLPFAPPALVTPRNGARAWIDLGPIDFQPSELAKVFYVLVIARYLRWRTSHRRFVGLIVPGVAAMVPVSLITLQPDLGTASLFVPTLLAMLVAAGARLRHIGIVVAAAALAAPASYPLLKPHQKERIVGLIEQLRGDDANDQGINFQSNTAQTLVGAGGLEGLGDRGARAMVYFNRLPERHNDTVYAVIVARHGFTGGAAVIGLYGVWIVGALITAARHREPQARLIGVGFAAFVFAQATVNIGMNLGVLPVVGVTLPFVSYGGSSLVTVWLMTGLVMNIGLHPARPPYRSSFEYGQDDGETAPTGSKLYGKPAGFGGRALTR